MGYEQPKVDYIPDLPYGESQLGRPRNVRTRTSDPTEAFSPSLSLSHGRMVGALGYIGAVSTGEGWGEQDGTHIEEYLDYTNAPWVDGVG